MPEPTVAVEPVIVDNPMAAPEKTKETLEKEAQFKEMSALVNDESPQWYSLIGSKGRPSQERFRPVNIYQSWDGATGKESFEFAVERQNPAGAFKRKCELFVRQFEKADAPPSLKK